MTDHDVEREVEANNQRQVNGEDQAEDDGPLVGAAEQVVNPVVNRIGTDNDRADQDDAEDQRLLNDAEQRRGE